MALDVGIGRDKRALLARGSRLTRVEQETGCEILEVAAAWAALHPGDGLCPQHLRLEFAGERAVIISGDGTPSVAETAPAMLGLELGLNTWQSARLVSDVLDLQYRLPLTWEQVCAARVAAGRARRLAFKTRLLTQAQAMQVDAEVVVALATVPWGRLDKIIEAAIKTADPVGCREREERAARWRGVRLGRETEDGLIELVFRLNADAGVALDAMCEHLANLLIKHRDALPDGVSDRGAQSKDEWRAVAAEVLANPFLAARVLIELDQPDLFTAFLEQCVPPEVIAAADDVVDAGSPAAASSAGTGTTGNESVGPDGLVPAATSPADRRPAAYAKGAEDVSGPDPNDGISPTALDTDDCDSVDRGSADRARDDCGPAALSRLPAEDRERARDAAMRALIKRLDPQRLLPGVLLNIHLSDAVLHGDHPVCRVEELGPQLATTVREWLGSGVAIKLQPIIDPAGIKPVDSYEVPDRMRIALFARSPASVYPFSTSMYRSMDIDHTIPYRPPPVGPPGQTGLHGLGPNARSEHRVKTFAPVAVAQPEPGTFVWYTQTGRVIITNPAGTHDLGTGQLAATVWAACTHGPVEDTLRAGIARVDRAPVR